MNREEISYYLTLYFNNYATFESIGDIIEFFMFRMNYIVQAISDDTVRLDLLAAWEDLRWEDYQGNGNFEDETEVINTFNDSVRNVLIEFQ